MGKGDADASRSMPPGRGDTGGKRKSVAARPLSCEEEDVADVGGDDRPGALLCDRFRFARGRLVVARSGEEADKTMGGKCSTEASMGEISGISMSGTPRLDLTSR